MRCNDPAVRAAGSCWRVVNNRVKSRLDAALLAKTKKLASGRSLEVRSAPVTDRRQEGDKCQVQHSALNARKLEKRQ
jgi:hypothetical protein